MGQANAVGPTSIEGSFFLVQSACKLKRRAAALNNISMIINNVGLCMLCDAVCCRVGRCHSRTAYSRYSLLLKGGKCNADVLLLIWAYAQFTPSAPHTPTSRD